MNGSQTKGLILNLSKGWKGRDYEFLKDLEFVEVLDVVGTEAENLAAICEMPRLAEVNLTLTKPTETVPFSQLKTLKYAYLLWWNGAKDIVNSKSLEMLYLDKPKLKDFGVFSGLTALRSLTLANCPLSSLDWLEDHRGLEVLEFLNCRKLSDFSKIGVCADLKRLVISGSKELHDLEFLRGLSELEVLNLTDDKEIGSLSPLTFLQNLKAFTFAGSTNVVDGDLSPLVGLPKLAMLQFYERRHYSHKLIKPWSWKNLDEPDVLLAPKK